MDSLRRYDHAEARALHRAESSRVRDALRRQGSRGGELFALDVEGYALICHVCDDGEGVSVEGIERLENWWVVVAVVAVVAVVVVMQSRWGPVVAQIHLNRKVRFKREPHRLGCKTTR